MQVSLNLSWLMTWGCEPPWITWLIFWSLVDALQHSLITIFNSISFQAFDTLLSSLDTRGVRESHLCIMLQKIESSFKENVRRNLGTANIVCQSGIIDEKETAETDTANCSAGDSPGSTLCVSSSDTLDAFSLFSIELGRNSAEKKGSLKRYQDFRNWVWKECFNSSTLRAMKYGNKRCEQLLDTCDLCLDTYLSEDTHCLSCHKTFKFENKKFDFAEHEIQCKVKRKIDPGNACACDSSLPLGTRLLTALLSCIEVVIFHDSLIKSLYKLKGKYYLGLGPKCWWLLIMLTDTIHFWVCRYLFHKKLLSHFGWESPGRTGVWSWQCHHQLRNSCRFPTFTHRKKWT